MKEIISIKGNAHGLAIQLDETVSFDKLKNELKEKLIGARKFFGASKVTIQFNGRQITDEEEKSLVTTIHENSDLSVMCIVDNSGKFSDINASIYQEIKDDILPKVKEEILATSNEEINRLKDQVLTLTKKAENGKQREVLLPDDCAVFHSATLRSGQQINTKNSIIVFGDVNSGSRIESGGSVVVLGKIKGVVHAGLKRSKAIVFALDMDPVQLKIGNAIGRSADSVTKMTSRMEPKIAFAQDDRIVIENVDNKIYKDLRLLKKI